MDMDGIMKKMGDKLSAVRGVALDLTDKAGKKAGEVYDVAKLKIKIADIRRDVNSLYREIGTAAYEAKLSGGDIAAAIEEKCAEITRLKEEIAKLETEVADEAGEEKAVIETEAVSETDTPAEE